MEQAFADDLAIVDPERVLAQEAGPELFRHYLLCGRYAEPIERYVETFGRQSVCVILAEELWGDPASVRARLEEFLEVELTAAPERAANPASTAQFGVVESLLARLEASRSPLRSAVARFPSAAGRLRSALESVARWNQVPVRYDEPDPALRQALNEWFHPANRRLEAVLGRSLEVWG